MTASLIQTTPYFVVEICNQSFITMVTVQGVRADGNSNLSDEIGMLLSLKSAAIGLR
jgi:hypothetical protein